MILNLWSSYRSRLMILLIFFSLCIIFIIVSSQIGFAFTPRDPTTYLTPNGERIIYLAPITDSEDIGLPVTPKELQEKGVVVVYEVSLVESLVSTNAIDAIIIHKTRVDEVTTLDLPELYNQGIVVAGIDITIRELAHLVEDSFVLTDPAWTNGWQESPFFSILALKRKGTAEEQLIAGQAGLPPGASAKHTDNILSATAIDQFLARIRGDIEMVKQAP